MTADEIYKQSEHLIDKKFIDTHSGKTYYYVGVLIGSDDYYYAMYSKEHGLLSLSCVGDIENSWGMELCDE